MLDNDHPRHTEAVGHHAEAWREEGLSKRICTCPPSASALNRRSASASLETVSDSDIPWKPGLPWQAPSDAITVVSPMRRLACMILFSEPGGTIPGGGGSGLSLKRISIVVSAPSALR
jgi:hypothetical protein